MRPCTPPELLTDRYQLAMSASYLAQGRAYDRVSFELFVRDHLPQRYGSTVTRTVQRIVGNRTDAEDVSQFVFMELAKTRAKFPGTLTGWSVTIGGNTQAFTSTGFGASCTSGLCSDAVSLAGSGLELLSTDTLTLSNFQGGWYGYFSAAEITVNGVAAPVPEPETYALMLGGLGVMGLLARRRRSSR